MYSDIRAVWAGLYAGQGGLVVFIFKEFVGQFHYVGPGFALFFRFGKGGHVITGSGVAEHMAGKRYGVEVETENTMVSIDEGSKFVITVGLDTDGRLVVCFYNTHEATPNTILSLMAELTNFVA